MYNVHQPWDPLKVCAVGRSYPPEFYSWITIPHVRQLFERIAAETEEDYQGLINKLREFGVQVIRPDLPEIKLTNKGQYPAPPMFPRDEMIVIGNKFYINDRNILDHWFVFSYNNVKDSSWPECRSLKDFVTLPQWIQDECRDVFKVSPEYFVTPYSGILNLVEQQGNAVMPNSLLLGSNGATIARIGRDLYFGTERYNQDSSQLKIAASKELADYRSHVVDTGGHIDGTFCPVAPGLIISLYDVPTYKDTFPDWEVVYLPHQSWAKIKPFLHLKQKNRGKWWIPGFEYDQDVIDTVEQWLNHWLGYVEETVFDVNILTIDNKNVLVTGYNQQVFDALQRHGITPHIVPFRHRYFWDGGLHCLTSDLHRQGTQQDYFKERN